MTTLDIRPVGTRPTGLRAAAVRPRGSGRGGNRLEPDRYPVRGPVYERRRSFGPDLERRDRHQRNRTRRAVGIALTRGELPDRLAAVLHQLLDRCTDTLLCPAPDDGPACSGWWSRRYIHSLILPADHPDPPADPTDGPERRPSSGGPDLRPDGRDGHQDPLDGPDDTIVRHDGDEDEGGAGMVGFDVGARTAGRWMAQLGELGWVEAIHRHRVVNGETWGTSNLWRFRIPDHLRTELHAAEDASRSRRASRHPKRTNGRTTPARSTTSPVRGATSPGVPVVEAARHAAPCPACEGNRWVPHPGTDRGVIACATCAGSGTTRAGP